ncbi:tubulin polyglutamylase TTLL4-like isoform X2 [Limulus polyphemus]|uniref:Tubulin polyglutamylase TTLL4-like isoform X2 n=1 Tax=Limulus polyphemus TaxID=6850 RepID=A0ABM1B198_LIMPO|nr:tubulin polyglutamylase TTLL4-like isoform X2 [Limulus polyphemus]
MKQVRKETDTSESPVYTHICTGEYNCCSENKNMFCLSYCYTQQDVSEHSSNTLLAKSNQLTSSHTIQAQEPYCKNCNPHLIENEPFTFVCSCSSMGVTSIDLGEAKITSAMSSPESCDDSAESLERTLSAGPNSLSLYVDVNSEDCMDLDLRQEISLQSISSAAIQEDLNSLHLCEEGGRPSHLMDHGTEEFVQADSHHHSQEMEECFNDSFSTLQLQGMGEGQDSLAFVSPLRPSLFPNVSPTINFYTSQDKVSQLPVEIRRLLRWKLSTITPVLIRQTVVRSGFRLTKKGTEWTGTWGKHMKCVHYKSIREFQKVNHFPGSFQLGRKDRLWQNFRRMQAHHGESVFDFIPETFILPLDSRNLRQIWEQEGKRRWILKPPASARGTGISVVSKWSQIPKKQPLIVQRYISEPYLINGTKFDLRIYVLVTSFDPLRIYIFSDGLARFASVKYSSAMRSLGDKFMHLTNYSINKKSASYASNEDEKVCQGHKWTLKALWGYMKENGVDTTTLWDSVVDVIIKTIISSEAPVNRLIRCYSQNRYMCYELFGFDIMLDKNLKPWLLEVNISPSLHSGSPLDVSVKSEVVKDMLNTVGYRIPEKALNLCIQPSTLAKFGVKPEEARYLCLNQKLFRFTLTAEEKAKHLEYQNKTGCWSTILDSLTPDDVRHLVESEDELARCGKFIRVFPTTNTNHYFQYLEQTRYYNLLLDAWEQKYHKTRVEGRTRLQELCDKGVHIRVRSTISKEPVYSTPERKTDELLDQSPKTSSLQKVSYKVGSAAKPKEKYNRFFSARLSMIRAVYSPKRPQSSPAKSSTTITKTATSQLLS